MLVFSAAACKLWDQAIQRLPGPSASRLLQFYTNIELYLFQINAKLYFIRKSQPKLGHLKLQNAKTQDETPNQSETKRFKAAL
jgi:hypothetical protein